MFTVLPVSLENSKYRLNRRFYNSIVGFATTADSEYMSFLQLVISWIQPDIERYHRLRTVISLQYYKDRSFFRTVEYLGNLLTHQKTGQLSDTCPSCDP